MWRILQFVIFASLTVIVLSQYQLELETTNDDYNNTANIFCANQNVDLFDQDTFFNELESFTNCKIVNFINCSFREGLDNRFIEKCNNLYILNVSAVNLSKLSVLASHKLTTLIATNNQLTNIVSELLIRAPNVQEVDFSKNNIKEIDSEAFAGTNNLRILNLSFNKLTNLTENVFFAATNLENLDLSHNEISTLDENIFRATIDLKHLNLSNNPIKELKFSTFAYLVNLTFLDLTQTEISSIDISTFSRQHKMEELNISGNKLKQFDFKLILPNVNLHTLNLSNNSLNRLNNYRAALFPQLKTLDINDNQFHCSILLRIRENEIDKRILRGSNNSIEGTNIGGISCNNRESSLEDNSTSNMNNDSSTEIEKNFLSIHKSNDITKLSLIILCIVLTLMLIMNLAIRSRKSNQCNQVTVDENANQMTSDSMDKNSNGQMTCKV